MGERRSVRGTESTEDMARVEEITDRADTGHSNTTGNLNTPVTCVVKKIYHLYFIVAMTVVANTAEVTLRAGLVTLNTPLTVSR